MTRRPRYAPRYTGQTIEYARSGAFELMLVFTDHKGALLLKQYAAGIVNGRQIRYRRWPFVRTFEQLADVVTAFTVAGENWAAFRRQHRRTTRWFVYRQPDYDARGNV